MSRKSGLEVKTSFNKNYRKSIQTDVPKDDLSVVIEKKAKPMIRKERTKMKVEIDNDKEITHAAKLKKLAKKPLKSNDGIQILMKNGKEFKPEWDLSYLRNIFTTYMENQLEIFINELREYLQPKLANSKKNIDLFKAEMLNDIRKLSERETKKSLGNDENKFKLQSKKNKLNIHDVADGHLRQLENDIVILEDNIGNFKNESESYVQIEETSIENRVAREDPYAKSTMSVVRKLTNVLERIECVLKAEDPSYEKSQ